MNQSDAVLDFNGYMHRLTAVVSAAKTTGHKIKIKANELHSAVENPLAMAFTWPEGVALPVDTPTVLYKHDGKYVLLTNHTKVHMGESEDVVGLLISKVGLKNCRIPDDQIPLSVPQATLDARNDNRVRTGNTDWLKHAGMVRSINTTPAHPQEFRNAPRFSTKQPSKRF